MISCFLFFQVNIEMNGMPVLIATPIRPIIPFSHAWIAMSITRQKWMTSTRMKPITNITAWPVWIVIPEVNMTKNYE